MMNCLQSTVSCSDTELPSHQVSAATPDIELVRCCIGRTASTLALFFQTLPWCLLLLVAIQGLRGVVWQTSSTAPFYSLLLNAVLLSVALRFSEAFHLFWLKGIDLTEERSFFQTALPMIPMTLLGVILLAAAPFPNFLYFVTTLLVCDYFAQKAASGFGKSRVISLKMALGGMEQPDTTKSVPALKIADSVAASSIELSSEDAEKPDEDLIQTQSRIRTQNGGEAIEGMIRIRFDENQRQNVVHLSFCPPFEAVPELDLETESSEVELIAKAEQIQSFGARIELKRAPGPEETVCLRYYVHF